MKYLGWLGVILCTGTMITVSIMTFAGLANFNASLLTIPEGAWTVDEKFLIGLGGAMRIAIYDYLGYYNICHLGDEVRDPGKTIPRAVMMSVVIVAAIYMTMNISIIAVVPWRQAMESKNIAALFMEQLYGENVAAAFTWMVIWTAVACVFAATLGYSRIPYAAAKSGDFFRVFAYVHPVRQYPVVSLWAVGIMTAVFCFFSLEAVITAAVTVRIVVQFMGQIVALHVLITKQPEVPRPFRMWLYPLPSLIAFAGWLFVLGTAGVLYIAAAFVVVAAGIDAYAIREAKLGDQANEGRWYPLSAMRFATRWGAVIGFIALGLFYLTVYYSINPSWQLFYPGGDEFWEIYVRTYLFMASFPIVGGAFGFLMNALRHHLRWSPKALSDTTSQW
jgi:amino acid transporter